LGVLLAEDQHIDRNPETVESAAEPNGFGNRIIDERFDDQQVHVGVSMGVATCP
jgi:hypothetical protein